MKEINGCERDSNLGVRWEISNYKFSRCPLKEITQDGLEYLEAYRFYKNGILPIDGGWLDQSQCFVDAMGIIDIEVAKVENKRTKEQQR